ncbi:MAG TPA: GNAT family N-acetyltransferase [Phycisphaerales bacterium]|nr:GNAT family N-acetyltransferase [Phycisphaerales bacterium]
MPPTAPAGVLVRPFTEHDVAPANALTNHYIQHTAIHFATQPATDAEFRDGWLSTREKFPWFAAEVAGKFAGYAKAYTWRTRAAYDRTAEVGLYVHPDFHRRGVGRALYAALINDCKARRLHTLVAGIALPNEGSVKLHEACGFTHTGTFREVGRKFDQWHDVGFWQLML